VKKNTGFTITRYLTLFILFPVGKIDYAQVLALIAYNFYKPSSKTAASPELLWMPRIFCLFVESRTGLFDSLG